MEPIVKMSGITKQFPGVRALDDIQLEILPGEVHSLLGENGAGKSTLMKILSGAYEPTKGEIVVKGVSYEKLSTRESFELGISIIYQELSVIDELSIMENIFVGHIETKKVAGLTVVDRALMRERTTSLLQRVGLRRDPDDIVRELSISEKQLVEIARALAFNANVIVMDEPTSSLTEDEIGQLFKIVLQLKSEGRSVVYISHKLDEIKAICDRVTVLKDGKSVGTRNVSETSVDSLVNMMVGRELQAQFNGPGVSHVSEEVMFRVDGLTRRDGLVKDVSFSLRRGEILGFSGLVGAGRSELMEAIYGARPRSSGEITLNGKTLKIRTPYDALKQGICMLTEDRRYTGILAKFSLRQNFAIGEQLKTSKFGGLWGMIDRRRERAIALEQAEALRVRMRSIDQLITELSGGNQQKVLLGRQLASGAELIIFDEPTKGIDVGAKAEFYVIMRKLADAGVGIIVVSSELPELLSLCDRIIVFSEGVQSGEFNVEDATEEKLVRAAARYHDSAVGD